MEVEEKLLLPTHGSRRRGSSVAFIFASEKRAQLMFRSVAFKSLNGDGEKAK